MNNVVIGDLGKYSGDDCLKFDGVNDYVDIPTDGNVFDVEFSCKFTPLTFNPSYQGVLGKKDKWVCYLVSSGGIQFFIRRQGGTWFFNTTSNYAVLGEENDLECCIDSSNNLSYVILNGVRTDFVNQIYDTSIFSNFMFLGATNESSGSDPSLPFKGCIRDFKVDGSEYIQNGDFGSTTLIDHSGNGNDGTINGATWWKQGIDEVFATPALYKSTWGVMVDDQTVIYTDALPYYTTDDVFWNPYNQDITYTFTVTQQQIVKSFDFNFNFNF